MNERCWDLGEREKIKIKCEKEREKRRKRKAIKMSDKIDFLPPIRFPSFILINNNF